MASINGSAAVTGPGSHATHSARSARARSAPSPARRTGPPSRMSTMGMTAIGGITSMQSLGTQRCLGRFNDLAWHAGGGSNDVLQFLAVRRVEFLTAFFDLRQELSV